MNYGAVIGTIGPSGAASKIRVLSTMEFCRRCLTRKLFVRVRPWPGESFHVAECSGCGNSQAVFPTLPEGPGGGMAA